MIRYLAGSQVMLQKYLSTMWDDILSKNYVAGNHGCLAYFRFITFKNLAYRYHLLTR